MQKLLAGCAFVLLCLPASSDAGSARLPGPLERRGLLATMRIVRDQFAVDLGAQLGPYRITHLGVSKLNPAYAWADIDPAHLDGLGFLLRRVDGIWIPIGSGSSEMFPCNSAPPGIIREWLGTSYARQVCSTLGYRNEPGVTVQLGAWQKAVRRPIRLILTADHSLSLRDISWTTWGATTSSATATLVESAADGEHTASVRIYVGDRGRYGATAYGYLLWTYVGAHLADYPETLHIVTLGKKPEIMP
jgi:hypothetical protein